MILLATLLAASAQTQAAPAAEFTLLVNYHTPPSAQEVDWYRQQGYTVKYQYQTIPALAVIVDETRVAAIAERTGVAFVEADSTWQVADIDNTWGVDYIGGRYTLEDGFDGAGIKVGVIDTGIDYNHPELVDVYAGGIDVVNRDADPLDDNFHGTHVSGTIAAKKDGAGVVGVAPGVQIYAVKTFDASGSGQTSDLVYAVDWTTVNGMDVVNNSWGGGGSATLRAVFDAAKDAGVIHVCSAGNNYGLFGVSPPAKYPSTYAISAMQENGGLAQFSDRGPEVDFAAPGVDILSAQLGGGYTLASGTSMAAPHVTGTVALLLAHAGLTDQNGDGHLWDEVRERLAITAMDFYLPGKDKRYGFGAINAQAAMVAPMGLDATPLVGGQVGGVLASGCTPGDTVAFLWGFAGGHTDVPQARAVLGVKGAMALRSTVADAGGQAQLAFQVPAALSGLSGVMQAVESGSNTSRVLHVTVN